MASQTTPDSIEKAIVQPRKAYSARGWGLLTLSFSTLGTFFVFFLVFFTLISRPGVIYSDIGTSPLYVLNGIWPADGPAPSKEDAIGAISAIVWSMTFLPLLKYVSIPYPQPEGDS
jgi:KUP system potassium uptake protein